MINNILIENIFMDTQFKKSDTRYESNGAQKQIEIYRKMSGIERLHIGFELYELARNIVLASISRMFPNISEEELQKKIRERMTRATG